MTTFYLYCFIYTIIFSLYMIYFFFRSKKKKVNKMIEIFYLEYKYNINLSRVDYHTLCRNIALINSFILTIVLFIMNFVDNYFIKLPLSLISIFILIMFLYSLLGAYYVKMLDD